MAPQDKNIPGPPLLHRQPDNDLHDFIAIGFGPASLAIAIALYDTIESNKPPTRTFHNAKVRFLEKQSSFAWHPGMLLRDSKLQISFMKDFATLRNPRSRFTFLNYLHSQGRLVSFTNLGCMLPQRVEYNHYMRWCASAFDDVVDYGREVESIEVDERDEENGKVRSFRVISTDCWTGEQSILRARQVVVAVGGRPSIPRALQGYEDRVIHSSQYLTRDIASLAPKRIAVIGGGQSAAEIFYDIPTRLPGSQSILITRDTALRPSDDSPFVNELFDPSRTDDVFHQDPLTRAKGISLNKVTNYGVVRLELLDKIYSTMYSYKINTNDETDWPHRILNNRNILTASRKEHTSGLNLRIANGAANAFNSLPHIEDLDVDLVIVACGYDRSGHEDLMRGLQSLRPENNEMWTVNRDYSVNFKNNAVEHGAGIWLQGCNQATHGLPDSLLSILSVRGGEMVESIFGKDKAMKTVVRKDSKDVDVCEGMSLVV